ncbi:hypothetical protein [Leisingera thetidis]|uniref:hypothetical protein n=1 Tax=Leisingera thetidis TaxID=2930199 RepID=UPI0021F70664|nr:hypothetical protein [Leisingera thetidis]
MRVFTYAVPSLAAALAAAFVLLAAPVEPLGNVDSNHDRKLSYQELTQAYPDVSRTLFASMDFSRDNFLDGAEYDAAATAGCLETRRLAVSVLQHCLAPARCNLDHHASQVIATKNRTSVWPEESREA